MDAPTADNDVVLASMGGKPRVPEPKHEDAGADGNNAGETVVNRQKSPGTSRGTEGEKWSGSAAERGVVVVAPRGQGGLRERAVPGERKGLD